MKAATVHQVLHGYRRGHELLAGSVRLPPAAADLVTRLSDLSGSMVSGWQFTSYVTGYPLSAAGYYALARTWDDRNAPRAGCVLTHTLLVPLDLWRVTDPRSLSALFAPLDALRHEDHFKNPLRLEMDTPSRSGPISLPHGMAVDFVRKFYSDGLRPLVWLDCPAPEDAAWAVVGVLWPALREHFSWCTASLQPRTLDSRALDLQFAPAAAYPRFHKIPRKHFVAIEPEKSGQPAEPWCSRCAQWIFERQGPGPIDDEIRAFGPTLGESPTLMRHLFLARDLFERLASAPTAGAGLLDVTEALAPGSDQAVDYKAIVAGAAVNAAMTTAPDEALECLFFVGERLANNAFSEIADNIGAILSTKVEKLSQHHVREALQLPERVISRGDPTTTPYFRGVVRGLVLCAKETPSDLACLRDFEKTAQHIIGASPSVAAGYLRGLHMLGEHGGRDALVGWIKSVDSAALRHELRREVMPEIRDDLDAGVVEELCRNLSTEMVGSCLSLLAKATDGFAANKVLTVVQDLVASAHPSAVQAWAVEQAHWSAGLSSLLSATFSTDATGFRLIVQFEMNDEDRRADLLTSFLSACTESRVPAWLKDAASQSADWLAPILSQGAGMSVASVSLLERLLPELEDVPIASCSHLRSVLPSLSQSAFWSPLVNLTLRSAVRAFVVGSLDEKTCRDWLSEEWASTWASGVSRGDLSTVLIHPVSNREQRERAFVWLAFAPSQLYENNGALVSSLFWELVSDRRFGWTNTMDEAWATIIRRVQKTSPGSAALRMSADVLRFGLDHTGDSVGSAVAAAFYTVYRAVCDSDRTPPEVSNLFGWFDWDKAKELRRALVQAFFNSVWRPGDLALSASGDEQLLRKLIKRIVRSEKGTEYINAMLTDLVSRDPSSAGRTMEIVSSLASNPDFFEPWD